MVDLEESLLSMKHFSIDFFLEYVRMVRQQGNKPTTTAWIFCEGEKTEFYYFGSLRADQRIRRLRIKINASENKDPIGLVQYAAEFKKHRRDYQPGDLIFCVFDRDSNSNQDLTEAEKLAADCNIELIFSNPCFEYWILSHFEYYFQAIEKDLLKRKLIKALGTYRKNDPEIYAKTKDKLGEAINNSRKVIEIHTGKDVKVFTRDSNPLTLVFKLIEKINDFK